MKGIYIKLLAAAAVAVLAISCIKEKNEELAIGDRLPEFSVETNDGKLVSNKSLEGSTSVVMFFHTSCPDCQQTLPVMQTIYDEYIPQGIRFVIISREEDEAGIREFWENNNLTMPFSAQKDRRVYEKFAKSRIPRVYVNDRNGIICHIYTDNPVPTYNDLKSAIENAASRN